MAACWSIKERPPVLHDAAMATVEFDDGEKAAGAELLRRFFDLRGGLISARAIGAFVAQPNLHCFVVRPLYKQHVCSCYGVQEGVDFDLFTGRDAVLRVEKTEAVEHWLQPFRS